MSEPLGDSVPRWRPASATGQTQTGRRVWAAIVGAALLAVLGAFLAWFSFLRGFDTPAFLPLCLSEYGQRFPVRAWVHKDLDTLRGLNWEGRDTFDIQESRLIRGELNEFSTRSFKSPAVLYLSGIALPGADDELYLLPTDADVDRTTGWIPLRDVFKALEGCKAPHKLLLLDVMQPCTDPRRGLLINDAAQRLQPLLDKELEKDKKLQVLCACSPGQVSLPAEELGQTAFVYFLCQGLRGHADGAGKGKRDGKITLQELAAYVEDRVDRWALHYRDVRQTPRLHGPSDDYPLGIAKETGPETVPQPPLGEEYPAWLTDGWKVHQDLWNKRAFRDQPAAFRDLEKDLVRAEHQWRGGIDAQSELEGKLKLHQRTLAGRGAEPPRTSLAQVLAREGKADAPLDSDAVRDLQALARAAVAVAARPNKDEEKNIQDENDKIIKKLDKSTLARALFEAAAAEPVQPAALVYYDDLARKAKLPQWTEIEFLDALAAAMKLTSGDAEGIRLALQLTRVAEQAAVADRRAQEWVWVGDQRDRAEALRESAVKQFLTAEPTARPSAAARLGEALKIFQARDNDLRMVTAAQLAWDEARVLLPGVLAYLEVLEEEPEADWKNAIDAACALRDLLADPAASDREARLNQLPAATEALQKGRNSLHTLRARLADDALKALIDQSGSANLADAKLMTALLETPCLTPTQRAALWSARYRWMVARGGRRHEDLRADNEKQAVAAEQQRALRRARLSAELLRLQGGPVPEKLKEALAGADKQPADPRRIQTLAETLRAAWQLRGR